MYGDTIAVNAPSARASKTSAQEDRRIPRSPRTTTCVSRTALTATSQRLANPADGVVDLTLGEGFVIVGHRGYLMTDLLGENTQAEPWSQHTFEDLCLPVHGERDKPAPQLGNLGIIDLGWKSHAPSVPRILPPRPVAGPVGSESQPGHAVDRRSRSRCRPPASRRAAWITFRAASKASLHSLQSAATARRSHRRHPSGPPSPSAFPRRSGPFQVPMGSPERIQAPVSERRLARYARRP